LSGLKIVIDTLNGVSAVLPLHKIFESFGAKVELINPLSDGNFPNCVDNSPDPSITKNIRTLSEKVKAELYDLGIAFDGDADRVAIVDNTGEPISGDILVAILSKAILVDYPGRTVVYDVKCTQAVADIIKAAGGIPVVSKTGFTSVKRVMEKTNAIFGGEQSGHYFIGWHYNIDDGIYVAVVLLNILAKAKAQRKTLRNLADEIPHYPSTPEFRLSNGYNWTETEQIIKEAKEYFLGLGCLFDETDGLKILFDDGWALIRASQTEPRVICRAEGYSEAALRKIVEIFLGKIRRYPKISFGDWNKYLDDFLKSKVDEYEFSFASPTLKIWEYKIQEMVKVGATIPKTHQDYMPVIEHVLREDDEFLKETFKNIFGINIKREEVEKIRITYDQTGGLKHIFKVTFFFEDKRQFIFSIKPTLIGIDPENIDDILRGFQNWAKFSDTALESLVRYGSHTIVYFKDFYHQSIIISHEYVNGSTLTGIIKNEELPVYLRTLVDNSIF
jgi:phosphomannomutase/phosphoglucomutase